MLLAALWRRGKAFACKLLCCERRVVYGGAVADYLPNAWTAANVGSSPPTLSLWSTTSFFQRVIDATLGAMFSSSWGDDNKLFGDDGSLTAHNTRLGRVPVVTTRTSRQQDRGHSGSGFCCLLLGTSDAKMLHCQECRQHQCLISSEIFPRKLLKERQRIERFAALFCCPPVTKLRLFSHFFQNLRVY